MKKFNVILASVSALAAVAFSTCLAYATTRGLIATVVDKRERQPMHREAMEIVLG